MLQLFVSDTCGVYGCGVHRVMSHDNETTVQSRRVC